MDCERGGVQEQSYMSLANDSSQPLGLPIYAFYAGEHLMGLRHDLSASPHLWNTHSSSFRPSQMLLSSQGQSSFDFRSSNNYGVAGFNNYPSSQLAEPSSLKHLQDPPYKSPVSSGKTRIRWTQELHTRFVECVNRLGGADKATPKGVLKLMDTQGLTIFHVKSHLQKYRTARFIPESSQGQSERRRSMNAISRINPNLGAEMAEALRLQLEVQRGLNEQLEVQRNLQVQIEEQGKQLGKMLDEQLKTKKIITNQDLQLLENQSDNDVQESHARDAPLIL